MARAVRLQSRVERTPSYHLRVTEQHQHYFTADPDAVSDPRLLTVELPDLTLKLTTDAGVFSPKQLDPGTRVLLENAPAPTADGDLLDVGCGYGPIALTLAKRYPDRRITGVDVNTRALELARANAKAAGVGTITFHLPEEVPADKRFAAIYSNPPIRVGKQALHDLLLHWLARLLPDGIAYLVVQKNLGSDSLAKWLTEQGHATERIANAKGYRVLAAKPRA
ncbi:methyltransferase [Kutzneria kofuensis]